MNFKSGQASQYTIGSIFRAVVLIFLGSITYLVILTFFRIKPLGHLERIWLIIGLFAMVFLLIGVSYDAYVAYKRSFSSLNVYRTFALIVSGLVLTTAVNIIYNTTSLIFLFVLVFPLIIAATVGNWYLIGAVWALTIIAFYYVMAVEHFGEGLIIRTLFADAAATLAISAVIDTSVKEHIKLGYIARNIAELSELCSRLGAGSVSFKDITDKILTTFENAKLVSLYRVTEDRLVNQLSLSSRDQDDLVDELVIVSCADTSKEVKGNDFIAEPITTASQKTYVLYIKLKPRRLVYKLEFSPGVKLVKSSLAAIYLSSLFTITRLISGGIENCEFENYLKEQVLKDALTQLGNRRMLNEILSAEIARAQRHRANLAFVMIDLDHFKEFNDTFGHLAGDQLLVNFANGLVKNLRRQDYAFRYGGEEFSIVMPETDLEGAEQLVEKLMSLDLAIDNAGHRTTFSAGISAYENDDSPNSLIERADKGLYEAKRTGRNRLVKAERETKV